MKNLEAVRKKLLIHIINLSEKDMAILAEALTTCRDHSFTDAAYDILAHTGFTYDNTLCTLCKNCPIKEVDGECTREFSEWAFAEVTK